MKFFGFYILNLNPLIISCVGHPRLIPAWAENAILFEHPTWYQGYWLNLFKRRIGQLRYVQRGIESHLILNTSRELKMANAIGLRSTFASQNVYLDESIFRPHKCVKEFDAVYVAKLERFKRHELAAGIDKLAVVKVATVDISKTCPAIAHAATNTRPLTFSEVADFINRSHCSLALSKEEGGMLASFESLLCGVPIVSTRSRGGRDIFYDTSNSKIVEANVASVAKAVFEFAQAPPNPNGIRAQALGDLARHRELYARYLAAVIARHGGSPPDIAHIINTRFENGVADRLFVTDTTTEIPQAIIDALS